ncbi:hypothetical protein BJ970_002713 [Saccharopolyspora phatthalungensis]|uniref:Uncharacterized protein n=1 Tax=Saccharopolyspora phatthalungensis TaxID=664693 RepID=A0A840Q9B5_9PSEU|nr:hypothetical protein [Saccharopolyspora phatthalungensis]
MDSEDLPLKVSSTTPAMGMASQQVPEMTLTMRYAD